MNEEEARGKLTAAWLRTSLSSTHGRLNAQDLADALLPVVRQIVAAELRAAADEMPVSDEDCGYAIRNGLRPGPSGWLRDRANALDPQ